MFDQSCTKEEGIIKTSEVPFKVCFLLACLPLLGSQRNVKESRLLSVAFASMIPHSGSDSVRQDGPGKTNVDP